MDEILYFERYREEAKLFEMSLMGLAHAVSKARSAGDLMSVRNQLKFLIDGLERQENRWRIAALRFMAGIQKAECSFHFTNYSRACSVCQKAEASNVQAA